MRSSPGVAYVPEGEIDPPSGHMRFAGTITTPHDVFAKVLKQIQGLRVNSRR